MVRFAALPSVQSSIGEYAQAFQGLYNATAIFEDPNRGDSLVIEPACHDSHNGSLFLKMARAFRARVVVCSMREWRPGCLVRERICRSRLGQSVTWGQGGNLKNPMPARCDPDACNARPKKKSVPSIHARARPWCGLRLLSEAPPSATPHSEQRSCEEAGRSTTEEPRPICSIAFCKSAH